MANPQPRYASGRTWAMVLAIVLATWATWPGRTSAQSPPSVPPAATEAAGQIGATPEPTSAEPTPDSDAVQQQLAVDVADLRIAIGRIDTRLQEIHEEVDRPLLSELWFGFISDRFTAVLNRMFGFDTGPSTPLWAAGALSLTLVLLKFLLWFANRFDEKSAVARVLGRTFGAVVTVYLILLTVSLFALAASAPGSRLDDYADQVAASEELLTAMGAVDQRVGTLLARLDAEAARTTAVAQAGAVLPPAGAEVATLVDLATRSEKLTAESLAGMASMQDALTRLSQSVDDINRSQHGVAWTWLVGVAALCSLATAVLLWNLHLTK